MAKRSSERSGSSLSELSMGVLQAELQRRESVVVRLRRQHARLMDKASKLEEQIRALGGPVGRRGGSGRVRPRNDMSLIEALAKELHGKTMSVTEVAEAVQRSGYQTTSPNFRTIVNQTLIKSDKFKKVGRGQYTAK